MIDEKYYELLTPTVRAAKSAGASIKQYAAGLTIRARYLTVPTALCILIKLLSFKALKAHGRFSVPTSHKVDL